jgi:hypothetical protein
MVKTDKIMGLLHVLCPDCPRGHITVPVEPPPDELAHRGVSLRAGGLAAGGPGSPPAVPGPGQAPHVVVRTSTDQQVQPGRQIRGEDKICTF